MGGVEGIFLSGLNSGAKVFCVKRIKLGSRKILFCKFYKSDNGKTQNSSARNNADYH